ncbi:Fur family transcriptional regulator [Peptococcus simiae]|uniref:Fur family transcriptional regulator n=1 Tax=Peptococcus simiae TaxID=1643805 RepID=A0ABW9GZM6_9FIRM
MKGKRYQTGHRSAIIAWFERHQDQAVTAAQLKEALDAKGQGISVATLYRNLSLLASDGWLTRTSDPAISSDLYVYQPRPDGFMLHCLSCGKTETHHCHQAEALWRHIADDHDFLIDTQQLIIRGYCADCQKQAGKNISY